MKCISKIFSLLTLTAVMLLGTGCESKWPDNGDLDDMWQLMSIEQGAKVTDVKKEQKYWSIRKNLVQFNHYNGMRRFFAHFERKSGQLILFDFSYEWGNNEDRDNNEWIKSAPEDERDILAPWGIFPDADPKHPERLKQVFTIEHLDHDNMILSTETYRLKFRKF